MSRLIAVALLLVLIIGLTVGCESSGISDRNILSLEFQQVAEMLDAGNPRVVLVDVRQSRDYDAGHIPGAIHIFFSDLRADDPQLKDAKTIIVCPQGWRDDLGPAATKRLLALEYKNVYLFRGGVELWVARERQLVQ